GGSPGRRPSAGECGGSGPADGDRRPGAHVHPVAVLERDGDEGLDRLLAAVDRGAVGRVLVHDRPAAVRLLHQHRVLVRDARVLRGCRQIDVGGVTGGVPAAADGDLVAGQRALLLGRVRGQVQPRGLGAGAVHHRHEVVAVRTDGRDPRGRALRLLRVAGSGRGLGGAGLRVAVTTAPAGAVRAAVAAGGRRDDPVVVTAAEGRTALLRGPPGLLRVGGRRRGPALEPLRSAGATGATMTAGTTVAAMTAGASVTAVVTGATVAARAGRGRCRTRRVAAEAVRARRDRLGGTVHLRGTRALVVEGVGAAAVRRAGLLPEGPAGALPRP